MEIGVSEIYSIREAAAAMAETDTEKLNLVKAETLGVSVGGALTPEVGAPKGVVGGAGGDPVGDPVGGAAAGIGDEVGGEAVGDRTGAGAADGGDFVGEAEGVGILVGAGAGAWARAETEIMASSAAMRKLEAAMTVGFRRVEVACKDACRDRVRVRGRQSEGMI